MAKKLCDICGKSMGLTNPKVALLDGCICSKCFQFCGFEPTIGNVSQAKTMRLDDLKSYADSSSVNAEKISNFSPTQVVNDLIKIDENSKTLIIADKMHMRYKPSCYTLFNFDQIIDFELLEDGESIASGGLGRAAAGALVFGGAGAVVGGITGKKKTQGICTSMDIVITVKDFPRPTFYIKLIETQVKKNSLTYKTVSKMAQDILSSLQLIIDSSTSSPVDSSPAQISSADEIRKFKELLDDGIITKEEFDAKKRELLNLC